MRVSEAFERLDDIHEQLTKAEVYGGFRVPGTLAVGVVGLLAAAVQRLTPSADGPTAFVVYWVIVAAVCALLGGGASLYAFAFQEDDFARMRTRRVFGQFLPCVVTGAVVTASVLRAGPALIALLPGMWAVLFGLGVVAVRPYMPRAIGVVGLFYLAAGSLLLWRAAVVPDLSGWSVGGVFGVGHLATAIVLYRRQEDGADV
jgi:hypothetical protein